MAHPFDRYADWTDLKQLMEFSSMPLRKSMRVNTLKSSVEEFRSWANAQEWQLQQVPWCEQAFFVDRDPSTGSGRRTALGKDLLHLMGHTYMQEAASMLPPALLEAKPFETILDMSAAPGSKTTQVAAMLNNSGVIIANDVQEKRLWTLKNALYRLGVTNVIVTKKVGQWFSKQMSERFDRVLCDAPCTAQGTSRKDSDALMYCSMANIGKMAKLQRELLESAIHAAKIGGRIVYSTCTLTPEENEEVVAAMLTRFPDALEVINPLGDILAQAVLDSQIVQKSLNMKPFPAYRLWPQIYDTEGFFCAVFVKHRSTRNKERFESVRFQESMLPDGRARDIGAQLKHIYGTTFMEGGDVMFERADQLMLTNGPVSKFHLQVQDYSLGLPFGKRLKNGQIRLDHEIVSLRGNTATKNILDLNQVQYDLLMDGKDTDSPVELDGDVILRFKNIVIGLGLARDGLLKNRLPRWVVQKS